MQIVLPSCQGAPLRRSFPALRKEGDGSTRSDEIGKGLVERRLPVQVDRIVQQLVKDDLRQTSPPQRQQVGQERIVEPTESAEGNAGAYIGIVPLFLEFCRFLFCGGPVEVAAVGNAAHDREPPRVRLEPITGGGCHDLNDLPIVDACYGRVAAPDRQSQLIHCKPPHCQDELELGARLVVQITREQRRDRLPPPKDSRFFASKANDIFGTATGEPGDHGDQRRHRKSPAKGSRPSSRPGRRTTHRAATAASSDTVGFGLFTYCSW